MSKIIKARFVIEDLNGSVKKFTVPASLSNNSALAVQPNNRSEELTTESADLIYAETKKMIEELMDDAQQQADNLLLGAKAQAQDLLEKSQLESQKLHEQTSREGFENGYQDGLAHGQEEAKKWSQETRVLLEALAKEKDETRKRSAKEIIDLVILLTEKILGTTAETKPEVINHIVKNVLAEIGEAEKILIKVNPIHIPYLNYSDEQHQDTLSQKVQIAEDATLKPGECQIITENGFIEAKITDQLEMLKKTILEVTGYAGL